MKLLVCLFILFLEGTVFSSSLNSKELTEPINGVSEDKKILYDKVNEVQSVSVNVVRDEPEAKQTKQLSDEKEDPSSPPVNGARDAESPHLDKKLLYDNINEGPTESVNGVRDEPEAKQTEQLSDEKEDPISLPVNGARDEESPRLDAVSADEGSLSEINYDSGWEKNANETQWCTGAGRSQIYEDTKKPINATQCQAKCLERNSNCKAVEFWESYNYACFECTDTTKIQAYTWTNDLSYPVYVWIKIWSPNRWFKNSRKAQWCTGRGRSLISKDTNKPINACECQKRCESQRPGCQAVEFWENYNYACFQCTDISLIQSYTWTNDWSYPVYVWIYD